LKNSAFNPFLFYSEQLQVLLTKASIQKNPALWLYKNDVRTVLFMLEALTRLHKKSFNEPLFDKWNKRFKKLEDLFGDIDEFIVLEKELKITKKVPNEALNYFTITTNNYIKKCNIRLKTKSWFENKLEAFDLKISAFEIDYDKDYLDELKFTIVHEIIAILNFAKKTNYQFTKVEEEVHEIRRKLRWLSIYAQALNGLVQLKKTHQLTDFKQNYFTKATVDSPYNKLPKKQKNTAFIEFDYDCFLALSWVVKELGHLKDKGLKIQKLSDALFISEKLTREQADLTSAEILDLNSTSINFILKEASVIVELFLSKDKILNFLVI
jgi:hypothetical protein